MTKTLREHFDESYVNDGWNDAIEDTFDEVERRLSALEHPEPDKQPSAQPAETEREWIPCKGVTVRWPDGEIVTHTLACAISYEYGDKQPEPPKGDM
jgi:hypothetical protein